MRNRLTRNRLTRNRLSRKLLAQNLRFLAAALLIGGFFYLIATSIPLDAPKKFEAKTAAYLLNALGTKAEYTPTTSAFSDPSLTVITPTGRLTALITDLCVGALEIAILFGVILATGAPLRKRALGCAGAFAAVMLFNPLRISAVLVIAAGAGTGAADLAHDLLFRSLLVALIVGYYFAWFRWVRHCPD